jgi:hypothetical protein
VPGRGEERPLPERNRQQHAAQLQLDLAKAAEDIARVAATPRPKDSVGFLLKATITEGSPANVNGLGSKADDVFVVDRSDDGALVHNLHGHLGFLRRKIVDYADPEKKTKKGKPKNLKLVAPLEGLRLASITDISDGWLRPDVLGPEDRVGVELWAKGGRLASEDERSRVKAAVIEFLAKHQLGQGTLANSFVATEHDIFMLEMTGAALMDLPLELPEIYHVTPPERPNIPALLDPYDGVDLPEVESPSPSASTVVILDSGVAERHPLLEPTFLAPGISAIPGDDSADDAHGHGTRMAGVATYGDLGSLLGGGAAVRSRATLQNQRILSGHDQPGQEFMLDRTHDAILAAEEVEAPRRVFSLSVGAPTRIPGDQTPWGAAVDQLAYSQGAGRLIAVAAGNDPVFERPAPNDYPARNMTVGLASPAEAVNAITVGAVTDLDAVDGDDPDWRPFVAKGQLSPSSRCDVGGNRPIKPDVVAEGGNLSTNGIDSRVDAGMQIVTTSKDHAVGSWLGLTCATSAATSQISGDLAEIWEANPTRWPQTIRGLLVHSARWTPAMWSQFSERRDRLRAFGYGRPNIEAARKSILERPTLILEHRIYPERKLGAGHEMHFVSLPMPDEELEALGGGPVEISITLSYFVEPNESRVRRYQGTGLRWGLQRPLESKEDFSRRINKLERDKVTDYETNAQDIPWDIGPEARSRGSVQSDRARLSASELTGGRAIGIWPVGGWWRDRGLRAQTAVPYSLIVTIDAGDVEVDLYTPILNVISVQTEIS